MDIKAKIEEIVNKAKNDKDFMAKLQKDPIKTVEDLLGVDLPDDLIVFRHARDLRQRLDACLEIALRDAGKPLGDAADGLFLVEMRPDAVEDPEQQRDEQHIPEGDRCRCPDVLHRIVQKMQKQNEGTAHHECDQQKEDKEFVQSRQPFPVHFSTAL